jgi:uncharacterized protein (TIGR01244 family)
MIKQAFTLVLAMAVILSVADQDAMAEPPLKVDLDSVVSDGAVQPVDGISASGQPDEAALEVFAAHGYTTIIDLRTPGEDRGIDESAVIEGLGMEYVALPIAGADAINFSNARKLDKLIEDADGPVLVHCGSSNRVGALLALRESLNGADDETALTYGREGGLTRLEGRVMDVLGED